MSSTDDTQYRKTVIIDDLVKYLREYGPYTPAETSAIVQYAEDCLEIADEAQLPYITSVDLVDEYRDWSADA